MLPPTDPACIEDPTIVACTGEDQGRQYDPAPDPSASATVIYVPTAPAEAVLAETGVPLVPYAIGALTFVVVGASLVALAVRDYRARRRGY